MGGENVHNFFAKHLCDPTPVNEALCFSLSSKYVKQGHRSIHIPWDHTLLLIKIINFKWPFKKTWKQHEFQSTVTFDRNTLWQGFWWQNMRLFVVSFNRGLESIIQLHSLLRLYTSLTHDWFTPRIYCKSGNFCVCNFSRFSDLWLFCLFLNSRFSAILHRPTYKINTFARF